MVQLRHLVASLVSISLITIVGCVTPVVDSRINADAPYSPADGHVYVFMGQDLGAVGGLDGYTDGYFDYVGVPAGITTYTGIGDLGGLRELDNWGSGDVHAQRYIESANFDGVMVAIGLSLVDRLNEVVSGELDENVRSLGRWIRRSGRPVFLRIGYEFEGAWNRYDPDLYIQAFRRIVDILRKERVRNFVTVWQSSGYNKNIDLLRRYHPGDDYVDWLGYSYFDHDPEEAGSGIRSIARESGKPVMIAEATPKGRDLLYGDGHAIWENWFEPFLRHVGLNVDTVKAIAYINVRWSDQPMWQDQGWGDTRIQANETVRLNWVESLTTAPWMTWVHGPFLENPPTFTVPDEVLERRRRQAELLALADPAKGVEAETFSGHGNAVTYPDSAASGGEGMAYIYQPGDSISLESSPGARRILVRYASALEGILGVYVDGERVYDWEFETTGGWTGSYSIAVLNVAVAPGSTFSLQFDAGDTAANIDYVVFDGVGE